MRALFIKEFRQGRPLLIFAAVMGLLVPAAYASVGRFLFLYGSSSVSEVLPYIFGLVAAAILPIIAIFAGGGVFAGEAHRGTLPILLGLPLSRRRIWASLVLAAAALTGAGGVLVVVITRLLLRNGIFAPALWAHLPDALCFASLVLSAGVFCSSLVRSVAGAIATTILLAGSLIGGAVALVLYFGAFLIGLPILDVALWCLLCSPALLLGSALAITRGELLQGFRKWLFSIPVMLAALALTVVVVCLVARAATPYRRSGVSDVGISAIPKGGKVLPLTALGGDIRLPRARLDIASASLDVASASLDVASAWAGVPWGGDLGEEVKRLRGSVEWPVTSYAVVLDLDTGKELYVTRGPDALGRWFYESACTRDGRFMATISQRRGLTYGPDGRDVKELRIVDTQQKKELYRGTPDALKFGASRNLSWSPTGDYLALTSSGGGEVRPIDIVRRDGSPAGGRPIILSFPSWSPSEDVIYGIDGDGALCRAQPDGSTEVVWAPEPGAPKAGRWFDAAGISPDGRLVAISEVAEEHGPGGQARRSTNLIRLVNTYTGRSEVLWREAAGAASHREVPRDPAWSSDGSTLYVMVAKLDKQRYERTLSEQFSLMRWHRGEPKLAPFGPAVEAMAAHLFVRPNSGEVLVSAWRGKPPRESSDERWQGPRTLDEKLFVIAANGSSRSLPVPGGQHEHGPSRSILGFDDRGRLLYLAGSPDSIDPFTGEQRMSRVEALDLDTGKVERVYP